MFKRIHTYDVDGVLLDSAHRHNFFPNGELNIPHYFAHCIPAIMAFDTLLPLAKQYRKDCDNPEIYVIVCSVRSNEQKHIDAIVSRLGTPNKILLVGESFADDNGQLKDSAILKLRALQRIFNLRQFQNLPRRLWEDSQSNIVACSKLFTECFLVTSRGIRL